MVEQEISGRLKRQTLIFAASGKLLKGQRTEEIFLAECVIQVATRRTSGVKTMIELKLRYLIAHKIHFR